MTAITRKTGRTPAGTGISTEDAEALARDLSAAIEGEVRFDPGSRALYTTDASNYRQLPVGIVIPRTAEDVVQTVATCRLYGAPLLMRGGGTSLAGQSCNVAVVIDMSKYMNGILDLDAHSRLARVQPGIILDDLRRAAERHHLTFGPDPATHTHCTLGGMIGNNSCGIHSVMAGKTDDNIEELEILTYDGLRMRVGSTTEQELEQIVGQGGRRGEIYAALRSLRDRYAGSIRERFPDIPRRVSGYNLVQLLPENGFHVARALVGSEGSCVTVLEATARLVYSPPSRSLLVLGYPDVYTAADHVEEIMRHGPVGLEGLDDRLVAGMEKKGLNTADLKLLPEGRGWLLVEFGGENERDSDDKARELMDDLKGRSQPPSMKLYDDPKLEKLVWEVRESGLGATAHIPGEPDTWPGWEDSAVPPDREGDYLRDLRKLLDGYGYSCALYGHFGQGCIHTRIDFDLTTREGIDKYRAFVYEAADLVSRYGGSYSGEHGDGQARGELLPKLFGPEVVEAFEEFKAIWDPDWKMNPGKVVAPYRIDQNLRLGTGYNPPEPQTHFQFPSDHGSFSRATLRCVGVGKCRRMEGGTMCPSFMVTREEEHSTRGRARLLFEMLQGNPITGGWRDDHVKDALDLCLACKGCKGDCPVNVDMATYKAEFLSHYYEGRIRPRSAYAFGLIMYWARLASYMPRVANFVTQTPLFRDVAKMVAGIAPERRIPAFAPQTFKQWFKDRGVRNVGSPRVILWGDTFNNHFHPATAIAAVQVLEDAGYQVEVPLQPLCCGRPLYDYGMIGLAKRLLGQVLTALGPQIAEGIPVVGLEPSCISVFRDELVNLFPNREDAKRLSRQSFLLSEFLAHKTEDYQPPVLQRKAVVQGHCHHKAVLDMASEESILSKVGLDYEVLDSGCCGMAGAFGFEKGERYRVGMKEGERVLLPAVRNAGKDTLIVADGFSCREQIAQATDRQALHLAQVLLMALREGPQGPESPYPEVEYLSTPNEKGPLTLRRSLVLGMALSLAGAALAWRLRKR